MVHVSDTESVTEVARSKGVTVTLAAVTVFGASLVPEVNISDRKLNFSYGKYVMPLFHI